MKPLYDIHCHIIPGVDDGATSLEDSIRMLKMEYSQGVRHIIATPHFRHGKFETPEEKVVTQYEILREEALKIGKQGIDLRLGCELHECSDMVAMLDSGAARTLAGSRYILLEFSTPDSKATIKERAYTLLTSGYIPIIAHVERYEATRKDISFIEEMVDFGAYIQVNTETVLGLLGRGMKKFTQTLMEEDLLHFICSDSHGSERRIPRMREAYETVVDLYGKEYAETIFTNNPRKVLKNQYI